MENNNISEGKKGEDANREELRKTVRESKEDYEEMLDYPCGLKCRICPFPGAQCTMTGKGHEE